MDRPSHEYAAAAAMAYSQQQPQQQPQQPPYGFHPQHQQFQHAPFLPPHPYPPFHRPQQLPQQLHPPPHPQFLHQQPPPSAYPPHIPPHIGPPPFGSQPYDSVPPPPPVAPPHDPELHKRIDKLAEYAAKNGPDFEAMIREKQQENPDYSFLFGGDGHGYYRYKLWLCTRPAGPFNPALSAPMGMMHTIPNPMLSPTAPPLNSAAAAMLGAPHIHQPLPPYYELQPPQAQPLMGQGRPDYEQSVGSFSSIAGPLPSDVAIELKNILASLTGTKDSIKSAKAWFMQRSPFAPALAEALRDTVFSIDDSEKQLHIVYLANDILFDSFQRRANPHDVDNEALAFKPVLGSMLARIYYNLHNKEENQSRLQKIVQFWATKEVYDKETINALEEEMIGGFPAQHLPGHPRELRGSSTNLSSVGVIPRPSGSEIPQWKQDKLNSALNQEPLDRHGPPVSGVLPGRQFLPNALSPTGFMGSVPLCSVGLPASQQPLPIVVPSASATLGEKLSPYPLFPPGLIPGMVRKQQIGSGVPYSPMSLLDIPTVIPPPDLPDSVILEKVNKFFKEIGEVNPSEGPVKSSQSRYEDDYEFDKEPLVRKGGACIPPPPNLQVVDPETGTYPDGTVERKPGNSSGRLGLGATAVPNEISQYDEVYTSYRKQRSTNYHSSMSVRAATR